MGVNSSSRTSLHHPVAVRDGIVGDEHVLTVMNYNTFLLEVNVIVQVSKKPNMKERAEGIAHWFDTLKPEEVPDVLVLNEIMSFEAESMLKFMGSTSWEKNAPSSDTFQRGSLTYIECDATSQFSYMTACVNSTKSMNPVKEGGVVVLVRKGLHILDAWQAVFNDKCGSDAMARKGFWLVRIQKGSQPYWIVGTHTQAWPGEKQIGIRRSQFHQMRAFVDQNVGDGGRVVFAGDMNIFENEISGMSAALGHINGVHASAGEIVPAGFWMPLDTPLEVSADIANNHYIHHEPEEVTMGSQRFDWILAPGAGDRLAGPSAMRYQFVPIKAPVAFSSEKKRGTWTDDLSDHYAVFAQLCYAASDSCPEIVAVSSNKHRGSMGRLPSESADVIQQTNG